jgi:preprotein translocase subunit Sec61beta
MSTKKKPSKRNRSRLPPTGLGLITMLDEETGGLKVKPEVIIVGGLLFIAASVAGLFFFPTA